MPKVASSAFSTAVPLQNVVAIEYLKTGSILLVNNLMYTNPLVGREQNATMLNYCDISHPRGHVYEKAIPLSSLRAVGLIHKVSSFLSCVYIRNYL